MNFRKKIRNFRRNYKAISPVIATLLMIAIAVVASLVTYAWVMGYMGFTTDKTGKAIQIQSVSYNATSDVAAVYIQNVGTGTIEFSEPCVYVDGAAIDTDVAANTQLAEGATLQMNINAANNPFSQGSHTFTVKVTSEDGTFSQINKNFPLP